MYNNTCFIDKKYLLYLGENIFVIQVSLKFVETSYLLLLHHCFYSLSLYIKVFI